jgi:uridine kinase
MGGSVALHIAAAVAPSWVRNRLTGLTGTRWIGVDGFGASGKSTLAWAIAEVLPGAAVISIDDFARAGIPDWNRELFTIEVVEPLRCGRTALYRHWDLFADKPLEWVEVSAGVPVIVEGVSAIDERLRVAWDVTLWVEAPEELRRRRIMARDNPPLLDRWQLDWWPSEQAYARSQRPQERVDAIVAAS